MRTLHRLALFVCFAALASSQTSAQRSGDPAFPCDVRTTERVVAVGDVHGAYDKFLAILRAADIIDGRNRWAGGKTVLVQTGDVLDRGPDSRKVVDFLRKLEEEAQAAGGQVYALLGNHELMRLVDDWRYVSKGETDAFKTADEMRFAFEAKGEYGAWVRQRFAVARINGILFVHGGISEAVSSMGCEGVNAAVRRDLFSLPLSPEQSSSLFSSSETGPLWYRGLVNEPEDAFAPSLKVILDRMRSRAIVVGHTPVLSGKITPRFGGRVIPIDTGMLNGEFYPRGVPSALEMQGDRFYAIYLDRREPLGGAAR
jgi:hypothetical protein